jgi:hypothetical protein
MKRVAAILIMFITIIPTIAFDLMCEIGYFGKKGQQALQDFHNWLLCEVYSQSKK